MSDDTGRVPTDEELAKIVMREYHGFTAKGVEQVYWPRFPDGHHRYLRIARALRAALCPPATPLAPGEMVTIPDCVMRADHLSAEWSVDGRRLYLLPVLDGDDDDSDRGMIALDAAGIAALEETCRRARAALAGGA